MVSLLIGQHGWVFFAAQPEAADLIELFTPARGGQSMAAKLTPEQAGAAVLALRQAIFAVELAWRAVQPPRTHERTKPLYNTRLALERSLLRLEADLVVAGQDQRLGHEIGRGGRS